MSSTTPSPATSGANDRRTHPIDSALVLGARGMLARAWLELLDARGIAHVGLARPEFDVTCTDHVNAAIDGQHSYVVNCAAHTAVDDVETNEKVVSVINGSAPGLLALRCREVGATLVHYSTDYVFNGQAVEPYPVDAAREPINAYGRTKALGEQAIEQADGRYLIVRTSWVYAPWGKNFVRTIFKLARQRDELSVIDDQHGRPTSSEHLAATTLGLLETGATGLAHVTDGGECTWFQFATAIAEYANPDCRVLPCTTEQYPLPAVRPKYSLLDISQTEQRLGPMPHWRQNLTDVLERMEP
jgi:dTDP-4-dehydrorhamnose reductase